jgi:6-phosphofructo-2-kinase/fructose-2,6-biphosphatase 4
VQARQELAAKFDKAGVHVVLLGEFRLPISFGVTHQVSCAESSCTNNEIVEANIRSVKISSPDVSVCRLLIDYTYPVSSEQYKDVDPEKAVQDYWSRIKDHEKYYEPVVETNWPFIRIINVRFRLQCLISMIHLRGLQVGEKIMVNVSISRSVHTIFDLSLL